MAEEDGRLYGELKGTKVALPEAFSERLRREDYIGKELVLGIRPEHASVGDRDPQDPSNEVFTALAEDCQISEDGLLLTLSGEEGTFTIRLSEPMKRMPKDKVSFYVDKKRFLFFDQGDGTNHSVGRAACLQRTIRRQESCLGIRSEAEEKRPPAFCTAVFFHFFVKN